MITNRGLKKRICFYFVTFLVLTFSLFATFYYHQEKTVDNGKPIKKIVRAVTTVKAPFIKTLTLYGTLSSKLNATLVAKETGILKILQPSGASIKKAPQLLSLKILSFLTVLSWQNVVNILLNFNTLGCYP
jgi:hypothetical protein